MKKLTTILFVALSYLTFAQPTENQIRVVGKHSETIKATQIELVFTLQEVTTLTYSKEKQVIKTISEVLEEVQSFISKNNYSKEKLSFQSISDKTFGNNTRNYSLSLNNIEKGIELINNLKVNGVTAVQINYVFDKSDLHQNVFQFYPITNFYFDDDQNETAIPTIEYDLFFVGTLIERRMKNIKRLNKKCKKLGLKPFINLYCQNPKDKEAYNDQGYHFIHEHMSYEENIKNVKLEKSKKKEIKEN